MNPFLFSMRLSGLKHGSQEEYDMFEDFAICRAKNGRMHGASGSRLQLKLPTTLAALEVDHVDGSTAADQPTQELESHSTCTKQLDGKHESCRGQVQDHHMSCKYATTLTMSTSTPKAEVDQGAATNVIAPANSKVCRSSRSQVKCVQNMNTKCGEPPAVCKLY